jgi:histidine phosphotransfer protein HptB
MTGPDPGRTPYCGRRLFKRTGWHRAGVADPGSGGPVRHKIWLINGYQRRKFCAPIFMPDPLALAMLPAMNAPPMFDETAFLSLSAELGADGAAEILETFLSDTSRRLAVIASSRTDRSAVKREAHSIKSAAATLGFLELSGIARELELGAESASPEQLHQAAETLRGAFDKALGFAEAELRQEAWRM